MYYTSTVPRMGQIVLLNGDGAFNTQLGSRVIPSIQTLRVPKRSFQSIHYFIMYTKQSVPSLSLLSLARISNNLKKKVHIYDKYGLISYLASCSVNLSNRKTYIATTRSIGLQSSIPRGEGIIAMLSLETWNTKCSILPKGSNEAICPDV